MIRYDLTCHNGHDFDGWFSNSEAYDIQNASNLVTCTLCGSTQIEKQLMAPQIPAKSNRKSEATQKLVAGPLEPRAQMLLQMMREIRAEVEKNSENVGSKFAEEARKIHYGEVERRGIYGEATGDDAKALIEEGIEVHPLPKLPEDGN